MPSVSIDCSNFSLLLSTTVIPIVFRVLKDSSDENVRNEKKTVTFDDMASSPTGTSASKSRREPWEKSSDEPTSTVNNRSNKKPYDLITYPVLVDVPKSTTCNNLYKLIDPFVPFPFPYSLHYVKPDVSIRWNLQPLSLSLMSNVFPGSILLSM